MKKVKRVAALSICILMAASLFSGCSNDGLALASAFGKSQTITSMQSQTDISVNVSATNMSKQEEQMAANILPQINSSKISVTAKINQNKDKTYGKVQEDFNMQLGEMPINMSVWADTDLTLDKPVLNEIVKMPEISAAQLPKEFQGKDYMIMNLDDMSSTTPDAPQIDYKKLAAFSKDFQPKLIEFASKYAIQFSPAATYVTRVGGSNFYKDNIAQREDVYEVKLTDKSFKDLMHYTLNNLSSNEDAINLVKDYMSAMMSIYNTNDPRFKSSQADINKSFNDMEANLPQGIASLNKALDSIENVKILGDNGISIRYTVNNDGYITNEAGNAQFVVDLPTIIKLSGNPAALTGADSNPTGIYTINVKFNTAITNINGSVSVVMPTTDAANSFKYTDLIKSIPTQPQLKK